MEDESEKLDMSKKPANEVAVFGLGVLIKKFDKLLEKLDKIDTKLYWLEKRDKERSEKD